MATTKKGDIIVSGIITPIVLKLKHNFNGRMLANGRTLIGKYTVRSMEIIEEKECHFELRLPDGTTIPLPNVNRITLNNKENWLMGMTREASTASEPNEDDIQIQVAQDMIDILREGSRPPSQTEAVPEPHSTPDLSVDLAALKRQNTELLQPVRD